MRTLALLAVLAALLGCIATWQSPAPRRYLAGATLAMTLMTILLGALTPPERLAELLPGARNGQLAYYHEGKGGTVAVVTQGQGERRFQRLYIQGVSNTGDAMPSLRYMRLQALLPLLIHGQQPDSALVIGFGTGITAGAMLRDPGLTRPVVAELLPEVLEAAPSSRATTMPSMIRASTSGCGTGDGSCCAATSSTISSPWSRPLGGRGGEPLLP